MIEFIQLSFSYKDLEKGSLRKLHLKIPKLAFEESAFPKHTDDFDEVSRFLEEHASFSFNLGDFDAIWQEYLEH